MKFAAAEDADPRDNPGALPSEILRMVGVSKNFLGTQALQAVDFDLRRGECHVLFGENGAGKSTLIQILAGVHKPSKGTVFHNGEPIDIQSVHHSRSLGISAVFQEFSIAPSLSVVENLFLGSEPRNGFWLDKRQARVEGRRLLDSFGFQLHLDELAGDLSRAEKQMLEIARAFRSPPSVLILDEPTASLTDVESERLFALVEKLKRQGVGIIYITHRMAEIPRIGDRVTVLRDGRLVATLDIENAPADTLIRLMTGKTRTELFPVIGSSPGAVVLEVRNLSTVDQRIKNADFYVRAGEVVGIAGLVGSGKGDIGPACMGVSSVRSGDILIRNENVTGRSPKQMLSHGLCYAPSDRRADGLYLQHDICRNISIASLEHPPLVKFGFLRRSRERTLARDIVKRLSVRPNTIDSEVARLSGGNQQKVMIGRFIARGAAAYIFDEPTVGVDVGARHAIYEQIKALCEEGAAILLISSDLSEIMNLSHRAYAMHQGRIVGECVTGEFSEEKLLNLMFGQAEAILPAVTHDNRHPGGINGQ